MPQGPDPLTLAFRARLGPRLKALRVAAGFDLASWARRVGKSRPAIYAWEEGKYEPMCSEATEILRIAREVGVQATADWLLGFTAEGGPPIEDRPPEGGRARAAKKV